jgi:hypothetical protein
MNEEKPKNERFLEMTRRMRLETRYSPEELARLRALPVSPEPLVLPKPERVGPKIKKRKRGHGASRRKKLARLKWAAPPEDKA